MHPNALLMLSDRPVEVNLAGIGVGDNVVVEPYFVDVDCDMCQGGSYHMRRQMGFIGRWRAE